jgi:hypothetical protein
MTPLLLERIADRLALGLDSNARSVAPNFFQDAGKLVVLWPASPAGQLFCVIVKRSGDGFDHLGHRDPL